MTTSTPAERAADLARRGFEEFHETFRALTRRAVERFEQGDWEGIRRDTERRLRLHARAVDETLDELRLALGDSVDDRQLWARMKRAFSISSLRILRNSRWRITFRPPPVLPAQPPMNIKTNMTETAKLPQAL